MIRRTYAWLLNVEPSTFAFYVAAACLFTIGVILLTAGSGS